MQTKAFTTTVRVNSKYGKGVTLVLPVDGKTPLDIFWRNRLVDGDIIPAKKEMKPRKSLTDGIETKTETKKGGKTS